MNFKTIDQFQNELTAVAQRAGAHSVACIRMNNPKLRVAIDENNGLVTKWLAAEKQGEMEFLERMFSAKSDPWKTFPFAQSVIVTAFTNRWGDAAATHPFPAPAESAPLGYLSAYARETDYHHTGQALLSKLANWLGKDVQTEATVDTKAVYERVFARVGGLGVAGGNGLLRVPERESSRVFLGCLFVETALPELILQPQLPFACNDCRACVKNCPTGALVFNEPIDARKCISYLTIEKRGVLNRTESEMIGDWLLGCDDCTSVCPPSSSVDLRIPIDLEWLLKTPAGSLRQLIKGTAAAYAGVTQLRKNAVIILKKNPSPRAQALLDWVRKNTGSDLILRQIDLE